MIKALVIGDPIEHSLSPVMQNEAFRQTGINGIYEKERVSPEQLGVFIDSLRNSGYAGCNVTIPHKVAVIPFLDELDDQAKKIGAVNTIVNHAGRLIGCNTDGAGFLQGLKKVMNRPLQDSNVLVIGAGGAARSILHVLLEEQPKSLSIANRTEKRMQQLLLDVGRENILAMTIEEAENTVSKFDVLINTTNAGMFPDTASIPLKLDHIREGTVVCDIIYNPLETKWLELAKNKGAIIDNGLSMLVMQGALAFEKWTGTFPDTARMKQAVEKELRR
jgi:shikimate dehydrogenase